MQIGNVLIWARSYLEPSFMVVVLLRDTGIIEECTLESLITVPL